MQICRSRIDLRQPERWTQPDAFSGWQDDPIQSEPARHRGEFVDDRVHLGGGARLDVDGMGQQPAARDPP